MKTEIRTDQAPAPIGPYNQAILVSSNAQMLFVSGQISINPATGIMIQDTLEDEVHQVMKNIGAVLEAAGMNYSNIIKSSIFILNMGDFGRINDVYAQYFKTAPPARETVQVSALPKGANVEISVVAASK